MRARDLGWIADDVPAGRYNAITDISGVRVGHSTIIDGEGDLIRGQGPVRTGVSAIVIRDDVYDRPVRAAAIVINGFGKACGLTQVMELGQIETPVLLTNTLNAFSVADAVIDFMIDKNPGIGITRPTVNPVVLECSDAYLNDIQGRHVTREHVHEALAGAQSGPVAEGSVGAGTGMMSFGYKAGIGTASRVVSGPHGSYVVASLVLANYGRRRDLTIRGVNVGSLLQRETVGPRDDGSVVVILGTDAPVEQRQLDRISRRAVVGLVRPGGHIDHGSGEFVLAFTTSEQTWSVPDDDRFFTVLCRATAAVTEEAVLNSLLGQKDMRGRDGHVGQALPADKVAGMLREVGHE